MSGIYEEVARSTPAGLTDCPGWEPWAADMVAVLRDRSALVIRAEGRAIPDRVEALLAEVGRNSGRRADLLAGPGLDFAFAEGRALAEQVRTSPPGALVAALRRRIPTFPEPDGGSDDPAVIRLADYRRPKGE